MRLAALVVACAACDGVFGLHHLDKPIDAPAADVPPDVDCAAIADEDGDCIADDLDDCPAIANASQQDSDHDNIGDDCDPHRNDPNDVQRAFFSFLGDGAADMAAWPNEDPASTTWSYPGDGALVHTSLSDTIGMVQSLAGYFDADLTVEVGFTFHEWSGTSSATRMAIWTDSPVFSIAGYTCYVTVYNNQTPGGTFTAVQDAGNGATARDSPHINSGDHIVLRMTRTATALQCVATFPTTTVDTGLLAITTMSGSGADDHHVAVSAAYSSVELRYVLIYGQANQ